MNKKGQLSLDLVKGVALVFLIIGVIAITTIIVLDKTTEVSSLQNSDNSNSTTILVNNGTSTTLGNTPNNDVTATRLNQTWLEFDGVDDVVTITYNQDFNFTNNFSVEYWYNWSDNSNDGAVISQGHGESKAGGWRTWHNTNGWIYFYSENETGGSANCRLGDVDRFDSDWHHVVFNYDTSNGVVGYFDGQNFNTGSGCSRIGNINITEQDLKFGDSFDDSQPFAGSIDNVILRNRTLTSKEVNASFNLQRQYERYDNLSIDLESISYAEHMWVNSSGAVFGYTGDIRRSLDKGDSWTTVYTVPDSGSVYMIYVDSADTIFTSRNGTLYSSMGNDTNWTSKLTFTCNDSSNTFVQSLIWHMTEDTSTNNLFAGVYTVSSDGTENCGDIYNSSNGGLTWDLSYNNTAQWNARHVHNVQYNKYDSYVYASLGDPVAGYTNRSRIIRFNGTAWENYWNSTRANIIPMEFQGNYSFFGEDQASSDPTSRILRTSNKSLNLQESDFDVVFTLEDDEKGDFYASTQEDDRVIYFGTFPSTGRNATIHATSDNGDTWYEVYRIASPSTIFDISNFGVDDYAYFEAGTGTNEFRFYGLDFVNQNFFTKINENSGTTAYDVSGNANNGTISGATWNNDGVDITLTEDVDYTISGTTFTLINDELSWDELTAFWNYNSREASAVAIERNVSSGLVGFFSNTGTIFSILIVVVIILAISIIIFAVQKISDKNGGL